MTPLGVIPTDVEGSIPNPDFFYNVIPKYVGCDVSHLTESLKKVVSSLTKHTTTIQSSCHLYLWHRNIRISRREFLKQMFGEDYQVLDIDYAVAERRRADIKQP